MLLLIACAPRIDLTPIPTRDFKAIATQVAASNTATAIRLTTAPDYQIILDILGPTGVILPLVADTGTNSFGSSFTTVGAQSIDFTWSEPASAFDTPPSLVGNAPVVTFNGVDEEADTPDADYWSVDDSGDAGFSVGAWVYFKSATHFWILTKRLGSNDGEWEFAVISTGLVRLRLLDQSFPVSVQRISDAAVSENVWIHVVATYDGTGGGAAMNGAVLYVDGVAVASTASNNGNYAAMDNQDDPVTLGFRADASPSYANGKMAGGPIGPFFTHKELSAVDIAGLYKLGKAAFDLP